MQSKILGIIGSIFIFLFLLIELILVLFTGPVLTLLDAILALLEIVFFITGAILVLIAVKLIANEIKHQPMFTNYLTCVILWVVAFFIFPIYRSLPNATESIGSHYITMIVLSLVVWGLYAAGAEYLKRSFQDISIFTEVGLFGISGLMFIAGASLLLALGIVDIIVGFIEGIAVNLFLIGWIFMLIGAVIQILAFCMLPDKIQTKKEGNVKG